MAAATRVVMTPFPALALYGDQAVTEVWYQGDAIVSQRYHDGRQEETGRPSIPADLADIFRAAAERRAS